MARPIANLRLFVGVYPPPEIAAGMIGLLDGMELPGHRATSVEQIHLTVQFVGDVPVKQLDDVVESVERTVSGIGGFALMPEGLITLPKKGAARLVAIRTDAPPRLLELQRRLVHRLARSPTTRGGKRREGDRFLPHFTLCRFRMPVKEVCIDQPVSVPPFKVDHIRLMKSRLTPEGAMHEEIVAVGLGSE